MKRNQWVCMASGIACATVVGPNGAPAWLMAVVIAAVAGVAAVYNWMTRSSPGHPDYVPSVIALTMGAAVMLALGWSMMHALSAGLALAVMTSVLVRWRLGRSTR
ncbi:hypothetical protein ACH4FX_10820 [Streptomyces sp. NPDC018019]|uniref:hypothetical protein n=1 Tax=Streptomyces sp. NPDC018019 TaxID=3365030 RepID=UPI0037AC608A